MIYLVRTNLTKIRHISNQHTTNSKCTEMYQHLKHWCANMDWEWNSATSHKTYDSRKNKWRCQKFQIENTKVKRQMCITPAKVLSFISEEAKWIYQSSLKRLQTHLANFIALHEENASKQLKNFHSAELLKIVQNVTKDEIFSSFSNMSADPLTHWKTSKWAFIC